MSPKSNTKPKIKSVPPGKSPFFRSPINFRAQNLPQNRQTPKFNPGTFKTQHKG
jgi:hypothetical protein